MGAGNSKSIDTIEWYDKIISTMQFTERINRYAYLIVQLNDEGKQIINSQMELKSSFSNKSFSNKYQYQIAYSLKLYLKNISPSNIYSNEYEIHVKRYGEKFNRDINNAFDIWGDNSHLTLTMYNETRSIDLHSNIFHTYDPNIFSEVAEFKFQLPIPWLEFIKSYKTNSNSLNFKFKWERNSIRSKTAKEKLISDLKNILNSNDNDNGSISTQSATNYGNNEILYEYENIYPTTQNIDDSGEMDKLISQLPNVPVSVPVPIPIDIHVHDVEKIQVCVVPVAYATPI